MVLIAAHGRSAAPNSPGLGRQVCRSNRPIMSVILSCPTSWTASIAEGVDLTRLPSWLAPIPFAVPSPRSSLGRLWDQQG